MVAPLIGLAARAAATYAAKKLAKKVVKKKSKKKYKPQTTLERTLRSENKGDARVRGRIKELRSREESGLMSAGERQRSLNAMTKSSKKSRASLKNGKKISGVKRVK